VYYYLTAFKIKEVALELFATKGYENTTMREISSSVGIKASSIYSHYISKDVLFEQVVQDLINKINWENIDINKINDSKTIVDIKALLFHIFSSYFNFFANNKLELLLWLRLRNCPNMSKIHEQILNLSYERPILEVYQDLFLYGIKQKQIRNRSVQMLATSYISFISGYIDSLRIIPNTITTEQLTEAFEIYWDGFKYKD
jgi:AcrR family transcriptional regulator